MFSEPCSKACSNSVRWTTPRAAARPGIEIYGGQNSFESIGQQSLLFASAGFFFSAAEAQVLAKLQASCGRFERMGVHQARAALG